MRTFLMAVMLVLAAALAIWITWVTWRLLFTEIRGQREEGRRTPPPWVWVVGTILAFSVMAVVIWLTR